jgi:hypothetical protein
MLEGINKSAEEGKPTMFLHCGKLYGPDAASVLACLNVCSYVAENVARLNTKLISVSLEYPEVYPIMIETVREAYSAANNPAFKEESVRYFPGYSYTMEVMGLIEQERPGTIVYMGAWDHSALIQSTVGFVIGAMQIAGTANVAQLPFFIANCDYVLIGEEFLAAGAKVSGDPIAISTIFAQDLFKAIVLIIIVSGTLLVTGGFTQITSWLGV